MNEIDSWRDMHNIYETSKANIAQSIFKVNFKVHPVQLSEM